MIEFYFKVSNARRADLPLPPTNPRLRLGFRTFGWRSRKIVYNPRPECLMPWRMWCKCLGFASALISYTPGNQTFWPRVVIYFLNVFNWFWLLNILTLNTSMLKIQHVYEIKKCLCAPGADYFNSFLRE